MFAVSSVRSLSNFWNRAKWDFLMQNEAIQFWQWVCGKFLSLWPNVYYWWINICWTTSWQIFCRLIAANKYLALQIISPTNDVQVRIFEYDRIFFGEKRFPRNFFIITLVLRYFYSVLFFENQVSIELPQAKCSDTAWLVSPAENFHEWQILAEGQDPTCLGGLEDRFASKRTGVELWGAVW